MSPTHRHRQALQRSSHTLCFPHDESAGSRARSLVVALVPSGPLARARSPAPQIRGRSMSSDPVPFLPDGALHCGMLGIEAILTLT
jgi:hypothetical protein